MNEKLNFHDLVGSLSEKAGITKKDAENFLREFFDLTTNALLEEEQVKIKNLGTFKIVDVNERESVDVRTGERVVIPSHSKVSFAPDLTLSKTINEPFAMFEPVEIEDDAVEEKDTEQSDSFTETPVETVIPNIVEPIIEEKPEENIIPEEDKSTENIAEPEQIQTPEPEEEPIPEERPVRRKKKKGKKTFFILLSVAVIIFAVIYCILNKEFVVEKFNYYAAKITHKQEKEDILKQNDDIKTEDTFTAEENTFPEEKDTFAAENAMETGIESPVANPIEEKTEQQLAAKETTTAATPDVKIRKIAAGERLTIIALQEYGSKDFWVYLYEENKATIKNPGNILVGSKIIIPLASKYGIDKNDPESIKKAKELQLKYK